MAKGIYVGVNKTGTTSVARKVTTSYMGVNGIARKFTAGYVGVNGVARPVFGGGVIWNKYGCYEEEVPSDIYVECEENEYGEKIGDTYSSFEDGGYSSIIYYCDDYYFDEERGFCGVGGGVVETEDEVGDAIGKYNVSTESVWLITDAAAEIQYGNYVGFEVAAELVALCQQDGYYLKYTPSSTLYDTIEAEEGELPEDGELIEGSADGDYCVLYISDDDEYFYYEKQ